MADAIEILHVESTHLDEVAPLFDAYRVWYGAESNPAGARHFLSQRLQNNESVIFLARVNGEPAGFTQLYPLFSSVRMESIWLLNDLFVGADFRRQGLGTQLMQTAAQFGKESGALRLELATGVENVAAQNAYEKFGWEKNEEFLNYALRCVD